MDKSMTAELYLSFAAIFHRPNLEVSNHFEELVELWAEVIPEIDESVQILKSFHQQFPPGEERLNALWEHYIPLFETGVVEASPYASVYCGNEGLVMGKEAANVKQFYTNCGYVMGEESGEFPDHLAVELEFCALLAQNGQDDSLKDFRIKHLEPFLKRVLPRIKTSGRPVYSEVAKILEVRQLNLQKEGDFVG